jgi:hypothetical protein
MNWFTFVVCAAVASVLAGMTVRADDANTLPVDRPTTVNGIEVACTGIGEEAQSDPRWPDYAVRIEFADGQAQYLADMDVTIADGNGEVLFHLRCDSPWFLAKLAPGKYTVTGSYQDRLTKTAKFAAPVKGQARIVVRFPEVVSE